MVIRGPVIVVVLAVMTAGVVWVRSLWPAFLVAFAVLLALAVSSSRRREDPFARQPAVLPAAFLGLLTLAYVGRVLGVVPGGLAAWLSLVWLSYQFLAPSWHANVYWTQLNLTIPQGDASVSRTKRMAIIAGATASLTIGAALLAYSL